LQVEYIVLLKEDADQSEVKNLVDSLQTSRNLEFVYEFKRPVAFPGFVGTQFISYPYMLVADSEG